MDVVVKQLRTINKPYWTPKTYLSHSETTGGPKNGILVFASTLDVPCVFVPKSPFLRFFPFQAPRLGSKYFKWISNDILHLITKYNTNPIHKTGFMEFFPLLAILGTL